METASSVVSDITPRSLKASMKASEDGLKKLGDALTNLSYAVRATGGGPWECWPGLVKEERKGQLEERQDVVDKLLAKGRRQAT